MMEAQTKGLSSPAPAQEDDDDQDEFFGSQDDEGDEFGALGHHDNLARNQELKTIGYVESYDETKEHLLQDGFEAGYRETFDAAESLGRIFGQVASETHLLSVRDGSTASQPGVYAEMASRLLDFLSRFQNREYEAGWNAKQAIELLECELSRSEE